jgi:hypothetical protein
MVKKTHPEVMVLSGTVLVVDNAAQLIGYDIVGEFAYT